VNVRLWLATATVLICPRLRIAILRTNKARAHVWQALEAGGKSAASSLVYRAILSAMFQLARRKVDTVIREVCAQEEALVGFQ
jgi:hypothetical protein